MKTDKIKSWAEWFERRAQYYDNPLMKIAYYIDGRLLPDKLMQATIRDVWKKLDAGNKCSLLDVGGGVGLFAKAFQSKLKRIVTTDISFSMVKDGHKLNPDGMFFVCEATALPFASSSFDRLLCYSVFHYFKNLSYAREVLMEFLRVVKNGGKILIGDISSSSPKKEAKQRPMHYPPFLKHNLRQTVFKPEFFAKFCNTHGLNCKALRQDIKGKPTSACRFDVLIEVLKQ